MKQVTFCAPFPLPLPTLASNHAHLHPHQKYLLMITCQQQEHNPSLNRSLGQIWLRLSMIDLPFVVGLNRSLCNILLLLHCIYNVHLQSNNVRAKTHQFPPSQHFLELFNFLSAMPRKNGSLNLGESQLSQLTYHESKHWQFHCESRRVTWYIPTSW